MSNNFDRDAANDLLRQYSNSHALRPPVFADKRLISAKLSDTAISGLRNIAHSLGYIYNGHGNISLLLEAIGTNTLTVHKREEI